MSYNKSMEVGNMQKYHSAGTSLNQIPSLHRKLAEKGLLGKTNFDNGAGKYTKATDFLKSIGVTNVRFDPYNLPREVNEKSNSFIGICDTSTCANVLNVIKEGGAKKEVLERSKAMLKTGGVLYISVYEGDRSSIGKESKKGCWQENKKLKEYLPIVEGVFGNAETKYGMIVARKAAR